MGATVVTGGLNADITGFVYDMVREAVAAHRSTSLMLPTLPDVRRAQHVLAADNPLGLAVSQLDRAIETQWALEGDGRRVVGETERRALLARAWASVAGEVAGDGTLDVLARLAQRATVSALASRPARRPAAVALLAAIEDYRARLATAGMVEFEEAAFLLAAHPVAPAELVVVHRFHDLGPAQEATLIAWATVGDVVATLPFDPRVAATARVGGLVSRLADAGMRVHHLEDRPARDLELDALARRLFGVGDAIEAKGSVGFVVAQGDEAEGRAIAARVAAALRAGVPPDRIAVAFRDPGRHHAWLRRAFADRGIDADFDVSLPAQQTSFGGALFDLWAFVTDGHARGDLASFLRSPHSTVSPESVDAADARWRESRAPDGPELLDAIPQERRVRALIEQTTTLALGDVASSGVSDWQMLATRLFAAAHGEDGTASIADQVLDAAVHRRLVNAVDALARLGGATPADVIGAVRSSRASDQAVEHPGRVQVMSVERLATRRFDVVILGGLTASEFPRTGGDDVFEGDAVQEAMRALGVSYDAGEETARERLLFALAVTRARLSLTLVRQGTDDEGRALRRSVFWDEALDIYRDPKDPDDMRGPRVCEVLADASPDATGTRPVTRPQRGVLADPDVIASLSASLDTVSASDIEAYLACPHRWFVERVLRPLSPDVELDGRVRGVLAHDALARFYRSLPLELGTRRVTPDALAGALELATRVTGEAMRQAPVARTLAERQSLGVLQRWVAGLVERDARFLPGYEPVAIEWTFGREDDPLDLGPFRLKGRVDRIDLGPDGLVVMDYKSSGATPVAGFEKEGRVQLQLYAVAASRRLGVPVAGGLYRALSLPLDRGFILRDVETPGVVRNDRRDADAIAELLDRAVERAAEAVDGMRSGRIGPAPDARRCAWCAAAGYCPEAAR